MRLQSGVIINLTWQITTNIGHILFYVCSFLLPFRPLTGAALIPESFSWNALHPLEICDLSVRNLVIMFIAPLASRSIRLSHVLHL